MSKKQPAAGRRRKSPKGSPFGEDARKRALDAYKPQASGINVLDAWAHVYHLLLSIDRRTRLAHVMDSNHMQPGGSFHSRAVRFTELLCRRWGIEQSALADHVDFMFSTCVDEYLRQRTEGSAIVTAIESADVEEVTEAVSAFILEVTDLIASRLRVPVSPDLVDLVAEIERRAEHYFTIEKKRQNVRGEGFEDVLEWLLRDIAGVPASQLRVRTSADQLPGFQKHLPTASKTRDKVPKPDIAFISPDGHLTQWILTAKWSLRQDRLDQFGQEAAYYRDKRTQTPEVVFSLVTNEMDVARLRDVLSPPGGGGGFHFNRVYHINCELLRETHGEKFAPLLGYVEQGRLLSLSDLLIHARTQFGPSH